jgi:hypothetical protein
MHELDRRQNFWEMSSESAKARFGMDNDDDDVKIPFCTPFDFVVFSPLLSGRRE